VSSIAEQADAGPTLVRFSQAIGYQASPTCRRCSAAPRDRILNYGERIQQCASMH
jgi:hypothetical protein